MNRQAEINAICKVLDQEAFSSSRTHVAMKILEALDGIQMTRTVSAKLAGRSVKEYQDSASHVTLEPVFGEPRIPLSMMSIVDREEGVIELAKSISKVLQEQSPAPGENLFKLLAEKTDSTLSDVRLALGRISLIYNPKDDTYTVDKNSPFMV